MFGIKRDVIIIELKYLKCEHHYVVGRSEVDVCVMLGLKKLPLSVQYGHTLTSSMYSHIGVTIAMRPARTAASADQQSACFSVVTNYLFAHNLS